MLRKISQTILGCALILTPAPVAMAFEEVCVFQRTAGYRARFEVIFMKRDNPNGLSPHYVNEAVRNHRAFDIHAHEKRCVNLESIGVKPGDRLNFAIYAYGGNSVRCPGPSGLESTYENFWLQPDGPPRGRLVFYEKDGATFHHRCRHQEGQPRMHSACNATFDGMTNAGCGHWRPELTSTVLHDIVQNGSGKGMLGSAIRRGADVNRGITYPGGYPDYTTPLHIAVAADRPEYAEYLLEKGANPNARDKLGRTPVMLAVSQRRVEVLRLLLDGGGSPTYGAHSGLFPLYIAARKNDAEIVEMLLEAGGGRGLNMVRQNTGETALDVAKKHNSEEVLELLRRQGADEKVYDGIVYDIVSENRGSRALREALHDGADANFPGEGGKTALHIVAERNYANYLADLLRLDESRLNVNAQDDQGRTPLLAAVMANAASAGVTQDLSRRSDPNIADNSGNFPLYQAVQNGERKIVQLLMFNRQLELNQRHPETGLTALGLAKDLAANGGGSKDINTIISVMERRGARE